MSATHVLIVDDKAENRYFLRVLLEGAGFAVEEAAHGAEALEQAHTRKPDLVISDILMPVMDGFALCRQWKVDDALRSIPFVFYTATYTDGRDRDFALSIGAEDFLVKPMEPDELVGQIRRILEAGPCTPPLSTPARQEEIFLRQYNESLVRKLETKMEQLEQDIAGRRKAEAQLRASEERFRSFVEHANDIIYTLSPQGGFLYVSPKWTELLGQDVQDIAGHYFGDFVHPDDMPTCLAAMEGVLHGQIQGGIEYRVRHQDGTWRWHMTNGALIQDSDGQPVLLGIARDISGQKADAEERERLQAQLVQMQKIESVGRLAGGIAHDFNNMLQVILGHVELALERAAAGQSIRDDLLEVRKAAERSAALTRQLLAFARKQTVAPRIFDLNQMVAGMLQMLRRLIRETIQLEWKPDAGPSLVRMDPSQIDQILANLCVNARDAMPNGGTITITTATARFSEEDCVRHPIHLPGHYIRLSVADNGCGMEPDVLGKIFEPFFTTKAAGEGTGLGLATVYGIVKQNQGFLDVSSEPGRGTVFHVYLPVHEEAPAQGSPKPAPCSEANGKGCVLLVEDDPAILGITRTMLERLGFCVLGAATPGEAIELAERHADTLHLLMTDIVMPEMNGRDLAAHLLKLHPEIKRLFMSGYTANVIAHHGVLEEGVHFLQKPFTLSELSVKIRETLET